MRESENRDEEIETSLFIKKKIRMSEKALYTTYQVRPKTLLSPDLCFVVLNGYVYVRKYYNWKG